MAVTALLALLLFGFGDSRAASDEPFPEYEKPSEVPVVGKLAPKTTRSGPPPARPVVRLATHYLEISNGASHVRCHGIRGGLIACRAHISLSSSAVAAKLIVEPIANEHYLVGRCETVRLIQGRLSEGACFSFVFAFNKWQQGPPHLSSGRYWARTSDPLLVREVLSQLS
jgi:hypothetical protein